MSDIVELNALAKNPSMDVFTRELAMQLVEALGTIETLKAQNDQLTAKCRESMTWSGELAARTTQSRRV